MARPKKTDIQVNSKQKLLEAATNLIRTNGYGATTVDVLCDYAGVSKGTFFHYFKSKEDWPLRPPIIGQRVHLLSRNHGARNF